MAVQDLKPHKHAESTHTYIHTHIRTHVHTHRIVTQGRYTYVQCTCVSRIIRKAPIQATIGHTIAQSHREHVSKSLDFGCFDHTPTNCVKFFNFIVILAILKC